MIKVIYFIQLHTPSPTHEGNVIELVDVLCLVIFNNIIIVYTITHP